MVSSGDGTAINNIDPAVGGLVWVRRRNGSWWPGRILGDDELPEGCMVTPRIGTPVKLLGRDDASVTTEDKSGRLLFKLSPPASLGQIVSDLFLIRSLKLDFPCEVQIWNRRR
ncbi:hypothetical protein RJ639_039933 [Escallonia herrerae]|uniref:PWWP domain-containing protein n=1 Tax=Escallonia herrerae TaxID=1293975 RepID=A0AA88WMB1_9ASTE|nr:hypothetical protein RJ639_039933 [Escallonia herrerae]